MVCMTNGIPLQFFGAKIVVDSAFQIEVYNWLPQSSQLDPIDETKLDTNQDATALRRLSECGMRIIQASFPRVKDALPYKDDGEREISLCLMLHLHN